ncbi:hypothetical protein RYX36_000133 [Vicia faba]
MALVEDGDKYHSQDQILTTPILMTNCYTTDLINKFMAVEAAEAENQRRRRCLMPVPTVRHVQPQQPRFDAEKFDRAEENYELSLGLSSNGRFGIDPNAKKIKRAVSIPESSMILAAANGSCVGASAGNLIRTCSLPVVKPGESREEWLRRKELQSQRRMEARRRKNEKRRQSRAARERSSSSGSRERGAGIEAGGENSNNNNNPVEQGAPADGLVRSTSLVRRVGGMVLIKEIDQVVPISPPTSGGSTGGSSSGNSLSDVQPRSGTTPMNIENSNLANFVGSQNKTKTLNFFEGSNSAGPQNKTKAARNPLDKMPSVTTKGSGPNGKRIEGFLYKYGRGRKNVKIVCVCHGSFLTPAEFVRHGGGGDVPNPLQEIIVNSSLS